MSSNASPEKEPLTGNPAEVIALLIDAGLRPDGASLSNWVDEEGRDDRRRKQALVNRPAPYRLNPSSRGGSSICKLRPRARSRRSVASMAARWLLA